jgi:hypothetical protein
LNFFRVSPHAQLALRADDSEGEFDEKDETFAVTAVAISDTAIPPVELGDDEDSEEEDEDKDQEMDEEEELSILQQLQSQEEAEEAESEKEGSDSEEEGDSEEEEEQTQREGAEPAEGLKSAKTKEPPSDLALSPSEEALQATQVDEVESMLEGQTATAVTSVPVLTQQPSTSISNSSEKPAAVKKAKNSIYAQLLLDEERQAKKQVGSLSLFTFLCAELLNRKPLQVPSSWRQKPRKTKRKEDKLASGTSGL